MEDIEYYVKLMQRQRLHNESKLKLIETESEVVHKNFMKTLQDLKRETEQCKDSITKNLNTLVAFKHSIHKIVHSSQDISGLPVPHDCAEYVKTMFRDVIEVCNNMGDIYKTLSNVKEYNVDPLKLIEDVKASTETAETELHQMRYYIAQLETLKENMTVLEQHILHSTNINDGSMSSLLNES